MTLAQALHNDPFAVGFDRLFDRLHTLNSLQAKQGNYPPYNILKRGENIYEIEIAVAGFEKNEIDIQLEEGVLTVEGQKSLVDEEGLEFLHKGIAERNFTRKFTLSDTIKVNAAEMESGILSIVLENVIPEHKKPRKIAIGQSEAQLLTEDK